MGFGVNDHLIRGLMRFVKMTSRKFIIEDLISKGGAPITNVNDISLKEGLISFIF
jgi:hypothetical protein